MGFLKNIGGAGGPGSLPGNPMFQVGMGLLSSGYDGSNPYQQVTQGLLKAQQFRDYQLEQAELKRQREEAERKRQQEIKLQEEIQRAIEERKRMAATPMMMPGVATQPGLGFPVPNLAKASYGASGGMPNAIGEAILAHGTGPMQSQEMNRRNQRQLAMDRAQIEEARRYEDKKEKERLRLLGLEGMEGGAQRYRGDDGKYYYGHYDAAGRFHKDQIEAYVPSFDAGKTRMDVSGNELNPLDNAARNTAGIRGAAKSAEEEAKSIAAAEALLPSAVNNASFAVQKLDRMLGEELKDAREIVSGPSAVGGLTGYALSKFGGDVSTYMSEKKAVQGQAFLDAFQDLKGGGHITEIEGQKATEARSRLSNVLSEAEEKKALRELKYLALKGLQRAQQKAKRKAIQLPKDLVDEFEYDFAKLNAEFKEKYGYLYETELGMSAEDKALLDRYSQ